MSNPLSDTLSFSDRRSFLGCFDFEKPLSLYIHIPFCLSKCSYCAFYSKTASCCDKKKYVEKLLKEIEEVNSYGRCRFHTAYIGGGNPGCLEKEDLERLAGAVCRNGRPDEFTVEMNPESISEEHADLFEKYFTRLSMGVQSFDEKALAFLGRNAGVEQTLQGVDKALQLKKLTGCQVNFDLITCLGSFHDYMKDAVTMVEKYGPDHISLYALTLEEGTALYRKKPVLPDSDKQFEILSELWNYLEGQGYKHYEVSNFAKPGFESKHNRVYWNYTQYMGLGSGAASTGIKNGKYVRINGISDFGKYSESEPFSSYSIQKLEKEEAREEFILMGMRHTDGLDLERLEKEFGVRVKNIPKGYEIQNKRLVPSDTGLMTADSAALYVDSAF